MGGDDDEDVILIHCAATRPKMRKNRKRGRMAKEKACQHRKCEHEKRGVCRDEET